MWDTTRTLTCLQNARFPAHGKRDILFFKCLLWQLTSCNWQNSFAQLHLIFLKMKLLKGILQNKRWLWQQKKTTCFCLSLPVKRLKNIHYYYFVNFSAFVTRGPNEDSKNTNGKGKYFISHSSVRITRELPDLHTKLSAILFCTDLITRQINK